MITVIGVRFRNAGKIYYFDPGDRKINRGASVIVETARGVEMGTVLLPNKEVEDDSVVQPLKPVIRMATDEDFQIVKDNKAKEKEAYRICKEKIRKHELEMKLVDVEYTFDNNKILFYFTANGRVDFRELVKDLASIFKTRIELRQIGVRDETKQLGGVGICGRGLCCHTYLSDFVPVSIKMAKEQNLSLNPTKISGVCGRLMCCLKNEQDTYEYLNRQLPHVGQTVIIREENVKATVQELNVLRQKVKVVITDENGDTEVKEYPVEELKIPGKKCPGCAQDNESDEEEEALERRPVSHDKPRFTDHAVKNTDRKEEKAREEKPCEEREERPRRERRPQRDRDEKRGEKNNHTDNGDRQNRRERGEKKNRSEKNRSNINHSENNRSEQSRSNTNHSENNRSEQNRSNTNRSNNNRPESSRSDNNRSERRQERGDRAENREKKGQERRNRNRRNHRRDNRQGDSNAGAGTAGERKNTES